MSSRVFITILCMHAAGICLGTIQARTHVQLALACQQSMIHVQHRLQLTMQHVYGHGGNLGDECAANAAALGTFGLTSSHNVATCWIHHNFDASVCFDGSTVPGFDDYFKHNVWNPVLELLFLEQVNGIFASYLVEIDLAKITLSCHFALDLQCNKEEVPALARRYIGHHCPWSSLCFCGTIATLVSSCFFYVWRVATKF